MIKELLKQWESKDQSKFYSFIILMFGLLLLSIGLDSFLLKISGAIICFSYSGYKYYNIKQHNLSKRSKG